MKQLGAILVELGRIDVQQLERALQYQQMWGVPLGRALIDLRVCDEETLVTTLSQQIGVEWMRLSNLEVSARVLAKIPVKAAMRMRAVPIGMQGAKLQVAMTAPHDLERVQVLRFVSGLEVTPVLASDTEIAAAISRLYHQRTPAGVRTSGDEATAPSSPAHTHRISA